MIDKDKVLGGLYGLLVGDACSVGVQLRTAVCTTDG